MQLKETFQAKLGWLVGQLYSRVGTDDWDAEELQDKKNKIVKDIAYWAPDDNLPVIEKTLETQYPNHIESAIDRVSIAKTVKAIPSKKAKLSTRIETIVTEMEPQLVDQFRYRESAFQRAVERASQEIISIYAEKGWPIDVAEVRDKLNIFISEFAKSTVDSRKLLDKLTKRISQDSEISSYVK